MNIAEPKSRDTLWDETLLPEMRAELARWYEAAKRDLPWRRTSDAYAITVSELMLQQTQVATVIPYYKRWLEKFPDWKTLAAAPEEAVLKAWEGLGYYRRARNLHLLAKTLADAEMPRSGEGLLALPGIGPYTAAAIGSIAFGLPLAVLDGNVMRVISRLLALSDDIALPQTRRKFQELADAFLDRKNPSTHNQAMMELGATVCIPGRPLCLVCPLREDCRGRDRAAEFPVKSRVATVARAETVAIIRRAGRIYCEQVPAGKAWHGLWRFPDFDAERMVRGEALGKLKYGITKYSVTMEAVLATWKDEEDGDSRLRESSREGVYLSAKEMRDLAFAAPHRKLAARHLDIDS